MRASHYSSGFSLVELSIVLVILGLLVGGVLSGQSLIHAAELRSIISEERKYVMATNAFKDKYFALPGDMTNATSFWGVAAGSGTNAACNAHVSTGTETCNGNGDGLVSGYILPGTYIDELSRYWQQLANAGLIEGKYTGTWDGSTASQLYASRPKSKMSGTFWDVWGETGSRGANAYGFSGTFGHYLAAYPMDGDPDSVETFTPEDAWNIDTKLDDGNPAQGTIIGYKGSASDPCTNLYGQVTEVGAQYNLSYKSKACFVDFVRAF